MADADFSLRAKDRKRSATDRLVRLAVSLGGVSVLAALILIFVYLALMVLPLFSDASYQPGYARQSVNTQAPLAVGVGDYGEYAYLLSADGQLDFWQFNSERRSAIKTFPLFPQASLYAHGSGGSQWLALADSQGQVKLFKPDFTQIVSAKGRQFSAKVDQYTGREALDLAFPDVQLQQLAIAVQGQQATLAGYYDDQRLRLRWLDNGKLKQFEFALPFASLDQFLLSPDGRLLYLLQQSELIVAVKQENRFVVRELVDLSQGNTRHQVEQLALLAGAQSLLVSHADGTVSQWFDVLRDGDRHLTYIRQFELASQLQFLLPDTNRKGFYSFYRNGTVQNHHTTSEKLVLFERAYDSAPQLAAMSDNERFVVTYRDGQLDIAEVDNQYPEISWSALWQKVWYESYPEPDYVWQTTSASDDFEAKFSLVPITFGTLKAALYAMLFAVPIAVLGAVYTAYFMSPRMRRVVKPSVELMEALPTVIIGFLAGLWFAPIVESHLAAIVCLLLLLPVATILVGALWHVMSQRWLGKLPHGWHALLVMPGIVLLCWLIMANSGSLEAWLFGGDVRLFLTERGINYDQRNALVVGFAMGFAVIPTIFTIAEDAIFSVPKHLSDGSLALGATPWQTLTHVVLLTASPGIFSAIMMGLGRAVGETMIVLMATGNTPIMDWNILEGMRTLSATIAVEMPESEVGSSHYRILFLAALILLVFTFAVNSLAEWVRQKLRERYRAL